MNNIKVTDLDENKEKIEFYTDTNITEFLKPGDYTKITFEGYNYVVKIVKIKRYFELYKVEATVDIDPYRISLCNSLRSEKLMGVQEWSEKHVILSESTASPGKYSTNLTPYMREPYEAVKEKNGINEVWFMKSAQTGFTQFLINTIGYIIDVYPCSIMIVLPTGKLCKNFSKDKFDALVDCSPRIRDKMEQLSKEDDTQLMKKFKNCNIRFAAANNAGDLRSQAAQYVIYDEMGAFVSDCEKEGDPMELGAKRTTTFGRKAKQIGGSTPTIAGYCKIEEKFMKGDQRYYNIPCPICDHKQRLVFENLKYKELDDNKNFCDPASIYYECVECKGKILERNKTKMMELGEWIPTNLSAPKNIRSYHINSLYSPVSWASWQGIIDEYLASRNDESKMKTFMNTTLGLTYRFESKRPVAKNLIERKSGKFGSWECPNDVVYVNVGVDVQDNRLACCVFGYGSDGKIYIIHYEEIHGDAAEDATWDLFLRFCKTPIKHESGINLYISEGVIDTGHKTHYVYDFCRKNRQFIPVKGRSDPEQGYYMKRSEKINTDLNGNDTDGGFNLYLVNTINCKRIIADLLNNADNPNSNYVSFNKDLTMSFFDMLCSEEIITHFDKTRGKTTHKSVLVQKGSRNEALDCFAYSIALSRKRLIQQLVGEEYENYYNAQIQPKIDLMNGKQVEEEKPFVKSRFR